MVEHALPIRTTCCIAGGGPAGMMLGFLLARSGVEVLVLEKHADFLRDFRGDTIHPSTLELIYELGLLKDFLKIPHQEVRQLGGVIGGERVTLADFSHLPTECRFLAFMPQWDFLDFLAARAKKFPRFKLRMQSEVTDLIVEGERVLGVTGRGPGGEFIVRADLVVGADGRHSRVREGAKLAVDDLGAPMDVLWMRLPKRRGDPEETLGRVGAGHIFITLDRGDYWQCAFVIAKGTFEAWRARGIEALRAAIAQTAPTMRDRLDALASFDDVRLLTVTVDRMRAWYRSGLLCIGDAAHAMSPIGGVGINLAVQDAVAAANILTEPLRKRLLTVAHLHAVQERRELPTRIIQAVQLAIQNRIIRNVLDSTRKPKVPFVLRLMNVFPVLRRIPARLIGLGIRPEHITTRPAI